MSSPIQESTPEETGAEVPLTTIENAPTEVVRPDTSTINEAPKSADVTHPDENVLQQSDKVDSPCTNSDKTIAEQSQNDDKAVSDSEMSMSRQLCENEPDTSDVKNNDVKTQEPQTDLDSKEVSSAEEQTTISDSCVETDQISESKSDKQDDKKDENKEVVSTDDNAVEEVTCSSESTNAPSLQNDETTTSNTGVTDYQTTVPAVAEEENDKSALLSMDIDDSQVKDTLGSDETAQKDDAQGCVDIDSSVDAIPVLKSAESFETVEKYTNNKVEVAESDRVVESNEKDVQATDSEVMDVDNNVEELDTNKSKIEMDIEKEDAMDTLDKSQSSTAHTESEENIIIDSDKLEISEEQVADEHSKNVGSISDIDIREKEINVSQVETIQGDVQEALDITEQSKDVAVIARESESESESVKVEIIVNPPVTEAGDSLVVSKDDDIVSESHQNESNSDIGDESVLKQNVVEEQCDAIKNDDISDEKDTPVEETPNEQQILPPPVSQEMPSLSSVSENKEASVTQDEMEGSEEGEMEGIEEGETPKNIEKDERPKGTENDEMALPEEGPTDTPLPEEKKSHDESKECTESLQITGAEKQTADLNEEKTEIESLVGPADKKERESDVEDLQVESKVESLEQQNVESPVETPLFEGQSIPSETDIQEIHQQLDILSASVSSDLPPFSAQEDKNIDPSKKLQNQEASEQVVPKVKDSNDDVRFLPVGHMDINEHTDEIRDCENQTENESLLHSEGRLIDEKSDKLGSSLFSESDSVQPMNEMDMKSTIEEGKDEQVHRGVNSDMTGAIVSSEGSAYKTVEAEISKSSTDQPVNVTGELQGIPEPMDEEDCVDMQSVIPVEQSANGKSSKEGVCQSHDKEKQGPNIPTVFEQEMEKLNQEIMGTGPIISDLPMSENTEHLKNADELLQTANSDKAQELEISKSKTIEDTVSVADFSKDIVSMENVSSDLGYKKMDISDISSFISNDSSNIPGTESNSTDESKEMGELNIDAMQVDYASSKTKDSLPTASVGYSALPSLTDESVTKTKVLDLSSEKIHQTEKMSDTFPSINEQIDVESVEQKDSPLDLASGTHESSMGQFIGPSLCVVDTSLSKNDKPVSENSCSDGALNLSMEEKTPENVLKKTDVRNETDEIVKRDEDYVESNMHTDSRETSHDSLRSSQSSSEGDSMLVIDEQPNNDSKQTTPNKEQQHTPLPRTPPTSSSSSASIHDIASLIGNTTTSTSKSPTGYRPLFTTFPTTSTTLSSARKSPFSSIETLATPANVTGSLLNVPILTDQIFPQALKQPVATTSVIVKTPGSSTTATKASSSKTSNVDSNGNTLRVSHELQTMLDKAKEAASEKSSEKRSVGWTTIAGVIVPYISRGNTKYVSVKMVESKMLSKYPSIDLDEMSDAGPIYSYYVSEQEAKLLSEINARCYSHAFGTDPFTTQDLIVSMGDFEKFYKKIQIHFENLEKEKSKDSSKPKDSRNSSRSSGSSNRRRGSNVCMGSWIQINNTVCPYIIRGGIKYVPVSVIKFAARLLRGIVLAAHKVASQAEEVNVLNGLCKAASVNFVFDTNTTKLMKLEAVVRLNPERINVRELNRKQPFESAIYEEEKSSQRNGLPNGTSFSSSNGNPPTSVADTPALAQLRQMVTSQQNAINGQTSSSNVLSVPNPIQIIPSSMSMSTPVSYTSITPSSQSVLPIRPAPQPITIAPIDSHHMPGTQYGLPPEPSRPLPQKILPRPTPSKPPPPPPPPPSRSAPQPLIKPVRLSGKTVSCILRPVTGERYALVEALARLYFPQCTLKEFQETLKNALNITLEELTTAEEQEFIKFYDLPVRSLKCKTIAPILAFENYFNHLKYLFKDKKSAPKTATSATLSSPAPSSLSHMSPSGTSSSSCSRTSPQARGPTPTPSDSSRSSTPSEASGPTKRPASADSSGGSSSKKSKSNPIGQPKTLGNVLAKLKQRQEDKLNKY